MAAPKWLCVALMAVLLSLSMCSAHKAKSLRFSSPMSDLMDESKLRHILAEVDDHEHGSDRDIVVDGGGAGGGGGGWSSGGSHASGGYGFGHGSGGSNGGGGGGGGWSSGGGGGYGGNPGGGSGYGYGHGGGSSGGGGGGGGSWSSGSGGDQGYGYGSGYGYDNGFYPPGFVPGIGGPFHCQPITCGNPIGCPGFVFHFTSNKPATVKDTTNDAVGNDRSKDNTGSKSPESG